MRRLLLAFLATVALAPAALAQTAGVGAAVTPFTLLDAWEKPPGAVFSDRGAMVKLLTPGSPYVVRERRIVAGPGPEEEWLRVAPRGDGDDACAKLACWVLNRQLGSSQAALRRLSGL